MNSWHICIIKVLNHVKFHLIVAENLYTHPYMAYGHTFKGHFVRVGVLEFVLAYVCLFLIIFKCLQQL